MGRDVATVTATIPPQLAALISMPSTSGGVLRPKWESAARRSTCSRSFYALDVGRGVATRDIACAQHIQAGNVSMPSTSGGVLRRVAQDVTNPVRDRFYALDVGRGVATAGSSSPRVGRSHAAV